MLVSEKQLSSEQSRMVAATERAIESGQDQQVTFRVVTGRAQRWAVCRLARTGQ